VGSSIETVIRLFVIKNFPKNAGNYLVYTLLAIFWYFVAYLALQIPDNFGLAYTPAFDDLFGFALNLACIGVWVVVILIALILALWRYRHVGYFLSLLAVSFASFSSYQYWTALVSLANASLPDSLATESQRINALPEIWPSPIHESREQFSLDLNSDAQNEIVIVDEYRRPGSSSTRLIYMQILRPVTDGYVLLLSEIVDEGRRYSLYDDCPTGPSMNLGYHSSLWIMNIDLDADKEVFAHQAMDWYAPRCRFDHFFDWDAERMVGVIPNPWWLWLHVAFPYWLCLLLLGVNVPTRFPWLMVGAVIFNAWAVWEVWQGNYSVLWLIAGLIVMILPAVIKLYQHKVTTLKLPHDYSPTL
jgi:hypothetical protein